MVKDQGLLPPKLRFIYYSDIPKYLKRHHLRQYFNVNLNYLFKDLKEHRNYCQ